MSSWGSGRFPGEFCAHSFTHSFIFNAPSPSDVLGTGNIMMNKAGSLLSSCLDLVVEKVLFPRDFKQILMLVPARDSDPCRWASWASVPQVILMYSRSYEPVTPTSGQNHALSKGLALGAPPTVPGPWFYPFPLGGLG